MDEDIFIKFPDEETFLRYWEENYVSVVYEDVKEAYEEYVDSVEGHIFISDYEENGCVSREDFMENLSENAQFAFQDQLTEVFYDKNPEIYENAFAVFEASELAEGKGSEIAAVFHETYQKLYEEFLLRLFDEKICGCS